MQDGIFQGSHEQMMEEYTKRYKKVCVENNSIDGKLFDEFGVKRGLRDKNGKGVLSGIAQIRDRRYDEYLKNDDRHDIMIYGISFCKKKCKVVVGEI